MRPWWRPPRIPRRSGCRGGSGEGMHQPRNGRVDRRVASPMGRRSPGHRAGTAGRTRALSGIATVSVLGLLALAGAAPPHGASQSIGPRSAHQLDLPSPRAALVASGHSLAPPVPDPRGDGGSGSRPPAGGSSFAKDSGPRLFSGPARATSSTRTVDGYATSVGARLLGLPGLPANAPPAR